MTTTKSPAYRSHTTPDTPKSRYHEPAGSSIEVREDVDGEDGVFEIRMPIATTGEVRNEGDDPLTRSELEGMAQQIGDGVVSVFPDHGQTSIGGPQRYSIGEKGGEWRDAEVVGEQDASSDEAELVATARLMDPDTLPDIPVRGMLGSIKELTNRGMSVPSSIGWRDDENAPGGNDLMEASIVGIGADPRTTSEAADAEVVARAAVEAGADPDRLLEEVRAVVGEPDDDTERVTDTEDTGNDSEAGTTEQEQESESKDDGEEFREFMREQQETQTELLRTLTEAIRQEDDDDEDDDEDEEEEENEADEDDEDEDEDEQSVDTQGAEDEDLKERISELEATLEDVRSGEQDVETPGDADTDEAQSTDDDESSNAVTATPEEWGRHTN